MISYSKEMGYGFDRAVDLLLNLLADLPDDFVDQLHDIERENTMSTELKIKITSLAAEAAIIRRHERRIAKARARRGLSKGTDPTWSSIQSHRRGVVRREARHSLLAQAFLRDRQYHCVEGFCWTEPDLRKVEDMAKRFAPGMDDFAQRWSVWVANAKAHLKAAAAVRRDHAGIQHAIRRARVPLTAEQRAARKAMWQRDNALTY